ncbi:MAG: acyl-CoA desaturase [Myxococcales bacterium]|nr:acyl-CoA desaturase [Myxococcales bacterium]
MGNRRIGWAGAIPFLLIHLLALGVFWTGFTWPAVITCIALYVIRLWGVTAGYHRYFSHRAFETGRVFQFILAFVAMTSAQRGVLWWAAHHRRHHKYSDLEGDLHSPVREGFWFSHFGWIFIQGAEETDMDRIKDFAKYPELVWLDKYFLVPPIILGVVCLLTMGLPGLFVGFFLSTVLAWHGTFFINSLAHVWGKRRFETTDDSRNNFWLALITLGEGWHNNHHRYQASARNGFYRWEVDITYYTLVVLSWFGIVWNLRPVPEKILAEGRAADAERASGRTPAALEERGRLPKEPLLDIA